MLVFVDDVVLLMMFVVLVVMVVADVSVAKLLTSGRSDANCGVL